MLKRLSLSIIKATNEPLAFNDTLGREQRERLAKDQVKLTAQILLSWVRMASEIESGLIRNRQIRPSRVTEKKTSEIERQTILE